MKPGRASKTIMVVSALFLGAVGLGLTFAPVEIAAILGMDGVGTALGLQVLGAAYLGWGMVNWMSRGSLFGGIYGRPLVAGNLLHFFAAGMALLKTVTPAVASLAIVGLGCAYGLLAISFGWLLFRSPVTRENASGDGTSQD